MTTLRSFFVFLVLSLFLCLQNGFADPTATVEGKIVDAENGEAMIGVSVMLQGTSLGAATDLDGTFRVQNVPGGTYMVIVSALGYAKLTVNNVILYAGKTETLNLQMKPEALEMKEVVIEATQVNNTEASLLSIQKKAAAVSDGISAEQIKKSPDADASGAVKRVTGVTIVGDKYVYVRGMGERYNNTRLNGTAIASPEPLKRTVPFDIIPANLLDNVIVTKTATPDQPGDFAGGSVQLNTREFPDKLTFSASATNSYNTQTSLKSFNSYTGGNKDWLGIDDGTRAIPGYVAHYAWWDTLSTQRKAAASFNGVMAPTKSSAPLNGSRSLSFGNQSEVLGKPLGYLVSLTYADNYSRRQSQEFEYIASRDGSGRSYYTSTVGLNVDRSIRTVNWGGILDLNARLSNNHKLSLKTLYTRSADDETRIGEGFIKTAAYRVYRLAWTERSLLTTQLKGAHDFPKLMGSRLDWTGAYSRGTYDQPDRRDLYYAWNQVDNVYQLASDQTSGRRRFSSMRDNVYEGNLDWTMPLDKFSLPSSKIKFGGMYRDLERKHPTRSFHYDEFTSLDRPQMDGTLPPEAIFSPQSVRYNWIMGEISQPLDSYNAQMKVSAAYAMGDMALGTNWRFIGGVRVENTDQHYKTFTYKGSSADSSSEGGPNHTDIEPSLNVTYKFNEKLNLRAAGSMTIANPDYAEIVPTQDQEYLEGAVRFGNPNIKHTKITNFDLRGDYYPGVGEDLSAGVFYKDVRDPIEWVITGGVSQPEIKPENFAHAHNFGAELEFRKSLDLLASHVGEWISFFSVIGNLTLVSSNVDLTAAGKGILTNQHRPLVEQSKYVINGTLAYDQPVWGSSVRLLFNTFGKRISEVGAEGLDDTYEMPFDKLDLFYSQKLGAHWSVKAQAANLLNSVVEFRSKTYTTQKYRIGRTLSLGFTYNI